MTTIGVGTTKAPFEFGRFLLVGLMVLLFAAFASVVLRSAWHAHPNQVPLKPCLSCQSCNCPKTLGSAKCLCHK